MTVEQHLGRHLSLPGEKEFIRDMRKAASYGVGYGFMQQVIEWEWQDAGPGAWGPQYFNAEIRSLENKLNAAIAYCRAHAHQGCNTGTHQACADVLRILEGAK